MKKDYVIIFVIALFLLSSALDYLAGPLTKSLTNPFDFLQPEVITIYPFTAVSIALKTIAVFTGVLLALSLINKKYLAKALVLLLACGLLELYSIQQIATGSRTVSLEWLLAFSWSAVALLLPTVLFFLLATVKSVHHKIAQTVETPSEGTGINP